jgi:hypothetical protein
MQRKFLVKILSANLKEFTIEYTISPISLINIEEYTPRIDINKANKFTII